MSQTLMTIPLSKLKPAATNVRKTDASAGLEELAASIIAHGVLQNLTVRPVAKPSGKPSGTFEVVAGYRRLAALKRLAKEKDIPKDYPVPCQILADGNPVEVSLAENVVRAPMHPADQFDAFFALHAEGLAVEDIAARFGVLPTVVRQRLKLAAVSPRLIELYRKGEMSLGQLMAFTVSDDHEAQERAWFESPLYAKDAQAIRRALTKALVEGSDRRARFIGTEAYEAAGGTIIRDLFRPDDEGYFADSELLDRLVAEKLAEAAHKVEAEGWSWVEVMPEADYGYLADFRRIPPETTPRSEEEEAKLNELVARYDGLVEEYGEDPPREIGEELERLADEVDALSEAKEHWSAEDMARAGALVTLDYRGNLQVTRGLVKADHEATAPEARKGAEETRKERTRERSGLSEAMVEELTAHRTAALREMLAGTPDLSLTALAHALALRIFYGGDRNTCLDITPGSTDLRPFAEGIGGSKATMAMAERHTFWRDKLPPDADDLWPWLTAQDGDTRLALLAYCTAVTVDAVKRRHDGEQADRLGHADLLAVAAGLDMADWWEATKESYFGRIPKVMILAAVTEAISEQAAENIGKMKKDAMAARAEELAASRRWVPKILRPHEPDVGCAQESDAPSA